MAIVTPSTSFSFLDAVNRVLATNGVLRGDTDEISSFSDLQHGATMNIAKIAIQDELNELVSDTLLPSERDTTGSITTVAGTRSYSLPSNFIRFDGQAMLLESSSNLQVFEYPGGEDALKLAYPNYTTMPGTPSHFYIDRTTSKKIAFFTVPNEAKTYTFAYEADPSLENATDLLPFHNDIESHTFCRMASRRFKYLFEGIDIELLDRDSERTKAKAALAGLMVGKNPAKSWAPVYR
jgi:hypothetical protein